MFSNYDYDIIIIGGGISGLFIAYKLLDTNLKVILFEGNKHLGGRIKTIKKNDLIYEAGAARIHSSHGKALALIHDLELKDDLIQLPTTIDHILRNTKKDFPYQTKNKDLSFDTLFKQAIQYKKKFNEKELQRITFFQYLTLIYDHETALYIRDSFGYDSEVIHLNADSALTMFESDFFAKDDYYILKNGMSQLIDRMEEQIQKTSTILKKNCSVQEINEDYIVTSKGDKFYFEHLICSIPQPSLMKFDYFKNDPLFQSVKPIPLLRIYAKYPTKNLWFKNIQRTITDNYIRHIIPINYEEGLIMISYTDDKNAELWNAYHSIGEDFLIDSLHKEIKELFGIKPPKPNFLSVHYWKDGFHLWEIGEDNQDVSKKILKPNKEREIYVCGEAFSLKQGWIEGSLDTCYSVLTMLPPLKDYTFVKYSHQCDEKIEKIKEIVKEEEIVKEKEIVKEEEEEEEKEEEKEEVVKDKLYTIEEVLKEDEWIIIEVDGNVNIYDVSKWIPKHPGGSAIFKGIEANKHYQNKKLYPDSPTDLFNGIHYHQEEGAFHKYFKEENDFVKYVGRLKS